MNAEERRASAEARVRRLEAALQREPEGAAHRINLAAARKLLREAEAAFARAMASHDRKGE